MDIHKPKPFHSVKEFFSEILVVVIGIVIALGGEQLIEMHHWRESIDNERKVLRADIKDQLGLVARRAIQADCIERRLAEIDMVLARHKARQPLGLTGPVGRPQNQAASDDLWHVAITGQAVNRMSTEERNSYSSAYSNFINFYNLARTADTAWMTLALLDRSDILEEGDWIEVRKAVTTLNLMEKRIKSVAPFVLEDTNAGVEIPNVTLQEALIDDYSKELCRPFLVH